METIFGIDQVDRPQLRRATSRIRQRERPLRRCSAPTAEISISIRLVPTSYTALRERLRRLLCSVRVFKVGKQHSDHNSDEKCLFRRFRLKNVRGAESNKPTAVLEVAVQEEVIRCIPAPSNLGSWLTTAPVQICARARTRNCSLTNLAGNDVAIRQRLEQKLINCQQCI